MGFLKTAVKAAPYGMDFMRATSKTSGIRALVGEKQFRAMDPGGQALGIYDKDYKVKPTDPIPTTDSTQSTVNAADIARRLAKAANGRDSTIRTSPAGALYATPPATKSLLGS